MPSLYPDLSNQLGTLSAESFMTASRMTFIGYETPCPVLFISDKVSLYNDRFSHQISHMNYYLLFQSFRIESRLGLIKICLQGSVGKLSVKGLCKSAIHG
ncbi:hypothetical protein LCGC14_1667440 [marine sediment metagenome]|uniref:Uncharacterized protein n=1 Tax=marine sediment metagenome TaxID=412755 RepID=A0A0F9HT02_9ZZZZ